jgi:hypothetical protein
VSYLSIPVDTPDGRPVGSDQDATEVQYAVLDKGEYHVYGDQYYVISGQAIREAHPKGVIRRRTVTITYGEWTLP